MGRTLRKNNDVYRLYGRAYQRVKRTTPRVLGAILGVSAVVFTGAALIVHNLVVSAGPAPLILGDLPYQKLLSQSLSDRASVDVNVANGNTIVKTEDLKVASVGPSLSVTRYFNSRGSGSGQAGSKTTLSVGADVTITANSNGSATYQGPSGFQITFPSNGTGGYTTPADYTEAKLAPVSGGGWKLTFNKTGDSYTFNSAGKQTAHANSAGLAITYAYNSNGTLASATDAQGKVTTFTNYSGTKVGTITDPAGRTVQYQYNTAGQLTDVTDTAGRTWHYEYWDGSNITWIVDPRNTSTTFSYDGSSRATAINYNDWQPSKRTYTYTYHSGYTQVFDPLNHDDDYWYDSQGRITSVVNAVGDTVGTTWDSSNNKTAMTDPSAQVRTLTYDSLNNLTQRQNPATSTSAPGAKETYDYTNTTHPYKASKKTDAAGNTTTYTYNSLGNVASSTSANSTGTGMGASTYKYQGDPNGSGGTITCGAKAGQLCIATDPMGNSTTYGYDTLGNVTTITPPGPVGVKTYTYDNLSRPKTITDGNGSKVTITYDNADRPTQLVYAQDSSVVTYTYDNNGNMTSRAMRPVRPAGRTTALTP